MTERKNFEVPKGKEEIGPGAYNSHKSKDYQLKKSDFHRQPELPKVAPLRTLSHHRTESAHVSSSGGFGLAVVPEAASYREKPKKR